MLLYRSTESKESVERRMYLRSIAATKLAEQQKQALDNLKVRFQSQLQPRRDRTTEQTVVLENEFDDDCAAELSVGEFLKQRMYKQVSYYKYRN